MEEVFLLRVPSPPDPEGEDHFDAIMDALPRSLQNKVLNHLDPEVVVVDKPELSRTQKLLWWVAFIITAAWAIPVVGVSIPLMIIPPVGFVVASIGAMPVITVVWWRIKATTPETQVTDNGILP